MLRCVHLAAARMTQTSEKQEMLSFASVNLVWEAKPCQPDIFVSYCEIMDLQTYVREIRQICFNLLALPMFQTRPLPVTTLARV